MRDFPANIVPVTASNPPRGGSAGSSTAPLDGTVLEHAHTHRVT
jgi:hypothetical protein